MAVQAVSLGGSSERLGTCTTGVRKVRWVFIDDIQEHEIIVAIKDRKELGEAAVERFDFGMRRPGASLAQHLCGQMMVR